MRRPYFFIKYVLGASFLAVLQLNISAQPIAKLTKGITDRTFHISSNSKLKLDGKTNVGTFICNCTEKFSPQPFSAQPEDNSNLVIKFNRTKLKMSVKSLDCGNKMMNKDLYKALNGDTHPDITIELLQVKQNQCNRLQELKSWIQVKALARISLNGISKEYWLNITAKKLADNRFRFIGSQALRMTDFDITPPEALMGMVKVKDEIKIDLDLEATLE